MHTPTTRDSRMRGHGMAWHGRIQYREALSVTRFVSQLSWASLDRLGVYLHRSVEPVRSFAVD